MRDKRAANVKGMNTLVSKRIELRVASASVQASILRTTKLPCECLKMCCVGIPVGAGHLTRLTAPSSDQNGPTYLHQTTFRAPVGTLGGHLQTVDFDTFVLMRLESEFARESTLERAIKDAIVQIENDTQIIMCIFLNFLTGRGVS